MSPLRPTAPGRWVQELPAPTGAGGKQLRFFSRQNFPGSGAIRPSGGRVVVAAVVVDGDQAGAGGLDVVPADLGGGPRDGAFVVLAVGRTEVARGGEDVVSGEGAG